MDIFKSGIETIYTNMIVARLWRVVWTSLKENSFLVFYFWGVPLRRSATLWISMRLLSWGCLVLIPAVNRT